MSASKSGPAAHDEPSPRRFANSEDGAGLGDRQKKVCGMTRHWGNPQIGSAGGGSFPAPNRRSAKS